MLTMWAVLLLFIGVTDGVKTFCNATQPLIPAQCSNATQPLIPAQCSNTTQPHIRTQCFGSLGGTVEVLLFSGITDVDTYTLKKNDQVIVSLNSRTTNIRYSFNVGTGIFTIKDINRIDNGEYLMEVHDEHGKEKANIKFYLTIQAPVSSPLLSRECLSTGQQRVSCSAEGDGLHYSLSLDGHPLNDTRLLSGPSSADVTLELGRSAQLLTCSVCNNVSQAVVDITVSVCDGFIYVNCTSNGTHISQWVHKDNNTLCPEAAPTVEPGYTNNTGLNRTSNGTHTSEQMESNNIKFMGQFVYIIAGSLSVMVLLLALLLGVYCAKKNKTSKDTTEAEDVTYADVSVLQGQGRRREQRETEVEYGQVKAAPGPRRTLETNVDECVYAQPQKMKP